MSSDNANATNEMQDMQKEVMAEALARAKCYGIKDADEAARFASEAADKLAEAQAEAEFARDFCDIRTEKMVTDALEATADKASAALVDVLALYHYLNGGTFEDRDHTTDGESLDGIPYVEVGYEDGSKTRLTGHFGMDTMADVARLMAYRNADEAEEA